MKKIIVLFALLVTLISCDNMVQTNYYPDNTKESEGRIIENNKTGEWNYWDKYGNLTKTEFYFETGELNHVREFYINGEMKCTKYFKDEKPTGEWIFWDDKGEVIDKEFYENGELINTDESTGIDQNNELISVADSAYIESIIKELTGIEKFAIKDNFYFLSSLLEFRGDSIRYKKVKAFLTKKEGYYQSYLIEQLDIDNAYISYVPSQTEGGLTITYWNLKDGSKLIATEDWGCGPVCSSSISFQKYKDEQYLKLDNKDIVPNNASLEYLLAPKDYNEMEMDPLEFKYILPQGGKNIKFCLDKECIELEWENERFKIKEK